MTSAPQPLYPRTAILPRSGRGPALHTLEFQTLLASLLLGLLVTLGFYAENISPFLSKEPLVRDGSEHYLADGLGTVLALTDEAGAVRTEYSYEPFGRTRVTGDSDNALQFTGRENDMTGIYYYRARYYSPTLHRFISQDPIGLAGGDLNLYGYAAGNPVNLTDPSGQVIPFIPFFIGAVILADTLYTGYQVADDLLNDKKPDWIAIASLLPIGKPLKVLRAAKTGADSALQGARLGEHLRQLERYGQAGFKELENGSIRYYGNLNPARTPGEMSGMRRVREWIPETGANRTWFETLDQSGTVRSVRPETGGPKVHYIFDANGNYIGTR